MVSASFINGEFAKDVDIKIQNIANTNTKIFFVIIFKKKNISAENLELIQYLEPELVNNDEISNKINKKCIDRLNKKLKKHDQKLQ